MKRVYYAHCQSIYDTPQERRDISTLENLGLEVENPASSIRGIAVTTMRAQGATSEQVMRYFYEMVEACHVFAFRALPDGSIPAGVAGELAHYLDVNTVPVVIELPSGTSRRALTVEQTREYLLEVGQR